MALPEEYAQTAERLAMHELGIAESILSRAREESLRRGGARLLKVGVRIGELSGVDPDALSFGFEALVKDTPLEGLALDIDFRKRVQRCSACHREFAADMPFSSCPDCGTTATVCISGDEQLRE